MCVVIGGSFPPCTTHTQQANHAPAGPRTDGESTFKPWIWAVGDQGPQCVTKSGEGVGVGGWVGGLQLRANWGEVWTPPPPRLRKPPAYRWLKVGQQYVVGHFVQMLLQVVLRDPNNAQPEEVIPSLTRDAHMRHPVKLVHTRVNDTKMWTRRHPHLVHLQGERKH
jgi:hypothetical protein